METVECAHCGLQAPAHHMDLIWQEGSTYPDYWQCRDRERCEQSCAAAMREFSQQSPDDLWHYANPWGLPWD